MIKSRIASNVALVGVALVAALYGCEQKEGPMEKAGKEVDKAAVTAGEQIEKAGDKIQETARGDKK